jgi:FkbM family methyltransferase
VENTQALETRTVKVKGGEAAIRLRAGSNADRTVIDQVFTQQDYHVEHWAHGRLLHRLHDEVTRAGLSTFIIDAGANIGASAVYFAAEYPGSLVYAVEPAPDNVVLLRANCAGRNVRVFEGAIGAEDGSMFVVDPGLGEFGYRVAAAGEIAVPVYSVATLMREVDRNKIFPLVFKIDIEGGEAALFSKNTEWVDDFPLVVIELHDWLLPFQGTSHNFLKTLAAHDFEVVHRGENLFCFNSSFFPRA